MSFKLATPSPNRLLSQHTRSIFTTIMPAKPITPPFNDSPALASFHDHLSHSRRIVAVLGAGLSAASGLPTFRGAGGLWRTHNATDLATPEAFDHDPGFVWQFYSYRRHMALNAKPNRAHLALAELARRNSNFITLSQNVDGLSPRAAHPAEQLKLLHGSLYDLKCLDQHTCGYRESNNYTDPITPALAIPQSSTDPTATTTTISNPTSSTPTSNPLINGLDISNATHSLPSIPQSQLPHCPKCKTNLLRPGVVWFGEALPTTVLSDISRFFSDPAPIDLVIVVGTSGTVYPAAGFAEQARRKGAKVAVVNPDPSTGENADWWFCGGAEDAVPAMLRPVVGEIAEFQG